MKNNQGIVLPMSKRIKRLIKCLFQFCHGQYRSQRSANTLHCLCELFRYLWKTKIKQLMNNWSVTSFREHFCEFYSMNNYCCFCCWSWVFVCLFVYFWCWFLFVFNMILNFRFSGTKKNNVVFFSLSVPHPKVKEKYKK